ncbi:hypothetical protein [Aurantimonas coralicida]|uniref:hypothetical protein n=1 Tax=Aurantimonas coralicida TaxID=182270 RepID=UPI001E435E51|nr:hypothetical protein [Aurantimonas coralicida]MCD1645359.1 hypothetical protein [Aurantimonas coralicida]
MAKRLLARAAKSRKQFSNIGSRSGDSGPSGTTTERAPATAPVATTCVINERPMRSLVMGGRAYVAGLSPIMRIADIPDLPDEMKAQMMSASRVRSASADEAAASVRRNGSPPASPAEQAQGNLPSSVASMADASGSTKPADEMACSAFGPVFSASEIVIARRLLTRIGDEDQYCVDSTGCDGDKSDHLDDPGSDVTSELCRKLAEIGLVSLSEGPIGLIVRRRTVSAS